MYPSKVLGTANFNNSYGVINKSIKKNEISNILNCAWNIGFRYLDTAADYRNVHDILYECDSFAKYDWRVITKLPKNKQNDDQEAYKKILLDFLASLKNKFKKNSIETILIHDHNFLKNNIDHRMVFDLLLEEKEKGFIKNIGLSVYDPIPSDQMRFLYKCLNNFVVQCPYSIFDRRFENDMFEFSNICKFQARSIFLQGLLLNENIFRKKFPESKSFYFFKKWLNENDISSQEACVSFVKHSKANQMIVGFNSEKEIEEFGNSYEDAKIINPIAFCDDIEILNPINW